MKTEELKLYNKYNHKDYSDKEYIYIGIDKENDYMFLYKNEAYHTSFSLLKNCGFDPEQIVNDLNLETYINQYGYIMIKEYRWYTYSKEFIERTFKPSLKDKINNIINR